MPALFKATIVAFFTLMVLVFTLIILTSHSAKAIRKDRELCANIECLLERNP